MDPRVERHAEVLVDHCTDVQPDDLVVVNTSPVAEELTVALLEKIGERGGIPVTQAEPKRGRRAYLRAVDPDDLSLAEHTLAMVERADVYIAIWADENVAELSDVAAETRKRNTRVNEELNKAINDGDHRLALTQYPGAGDAQNAEMSTDAYREFVLDAVAKDWAAQRAFQANLVDRLDPAATVRIVAGDETDLTMSVEGNNALNEYGEQNLPGGEVFTAPVPDSVEGTVRFDMPVIWQGQEVEGAFLEFEAGEVVAHEAEKNEDMLTSILETDEGTRRLGELGIGMNRDIDRFTKNMLFDEKMGDTVHLAVGRSIPESVGEDNPANTSATHVDMLVDMSEDARIEFDGEVVQRDGTFVFEEDFAA